MESAVHAAGEAVLVLPEQAIRVELDGASAVGAFAPPALPAVTLHDYGTGRAVFAGFDLLAEATLAGPDSLSASLLVQALAAVQPPVPRRR